MMKPELISIMGHTAAGKTGVAARIARVVDGEVISADSRQVYRGMDLGTGKDYADYIIQGSPIPYHLIDILNAGEEYNVFKFQEDFFKVYGKIKEKGKVPVLCGGSGMYIESVLRQYDLPRVPANHTLREELQKKDISEIVDMLKQYKGLHNSTDTRSKKRAIRAVEIAQQMENTGWRRNDLPGISSLNVVVFFSRETRRARITERLKQRLAEGMVDEAKELLRKGVSHDKLAYYGLEYKYLSLYLKGELAYEAMVEKLNTAIHQFAKRQMTYFRGMEKRGISIHWLSGEIGPDEMTNKIVELYHTEKLD
ncbi:tRNA (adenosine(37)-N6)-dimethylallyltransferase MiaA [Bacteroidota bacterium]